MSQPAVPRKCPGPSARPRVEQVQRATPRLRGHSAPPRPHPALARPAQRFARRLPAAPVPPRPPDPGQAPARLPILRVILPPAARLRPLRRRRAPSRRTWQRPRSRSQRPRSRTRAGRSARRPTRPSLRSAPPRPTGQWAGRRRVRRAAWRGSTGRQRSQGRTALVVRATAATSRRPNACTGELPRSRPRNTKSEKNVVAKASEPLRLREG